MVVHGVRKPLNPVSSVREGVFIPAQQCMVLAGTLTNSEVIYFTVSFTCCEVDM
jgi:hypothetical protein